MQQDRFSSAFVVNSMCLGVGTTSSDNGVDFPDSFSTTEPANELKKRNRSVNPRYRLKSKV